MYGLINILPQTKPQRISRLIIVLILLIYHPAILHAAPQRVLTLAEEKRYKSSFDCV